jgi:hypothetical protein
MESVHVGGIAGRARAARIGAGVAPLAMGLVVYGAYGDAHASSSQKSAVPFLLGVVAVVTAVVYGLLAPLALRAAARQTAAARRWALGLGIVSVLSLVVFWSGLPLIVGGAAAYIGYEGRSTTGGSRAYDAAWWLGLAAAALAVIVTILGNTVAGH